MVCTQLFFLFFSCVLISRWAIENTLYSVLSSVGLYVVLEFALPIQDNLLFGNVGALIYYYVPWELYFTQNFRSRGIILRIGGIDKTHTFGRVASNDYKTGTKVVDWLAASSCVFLL